MCDRGLLVLRVIHLLDAGPHFGERILLEHVEQVVGLDAAALSTRHADERALSLVVGEREPEVVARSDRQPDFLVIEMRAGGDFRIVRD